MAWTTPLTAVANSPLTSAQWNASVRDNFNETAPAKATGNGTLFVGAGANIIAERQILDNIVDTSETATSTTYVNLATNGPIVTIATGTFALTWINAMHANSTAGSGTFSSFEITGASAVTATDQRAIHQQNAGAGMDIRSGVCALNATTAGTNVFRMQYRVGSGTGSFSRRRMIVMAL